MKNEVKEENESMHWGIEVSGHFNFIDELSENEKSRIIKELERVLKVKIEWAKDFQDYYFDETRWMTYVSADKVTEVVERNKQFLKYFRCSILYLSETDKEIFLEEDGNVEIIQS